MIPENLARQRQEWRKERIAARKTMTAEDRAIADARLNGQLRDTLAGMGDGILGFYWPIQGEFDATPAVITWLEGGRGASRRAALPVVVARNQPVRFRDWTPVTVMQPAGFGTSVPSAGEWLTPTVLLIPLVGFDDAGFRLGYGGGYYDRTLAQMHPKPLTVGIGYAAGRLETIHPQSFDLRLGSLLVG